MNKDDKQIVKDLSSPDAKGCTWNLSSIRNWIWDFVSEHFESFAGEASAWLKWRICDYILAVFLLYIAKRITNSRLSRFVDFLLEH